MGPGRRVKDGSKLEVAGGRAGDVDAPKMHLDQVERVDKHECLAEKMKKRCIAARQGKVCRRSKEDDWTEHSGFAKNHASVRRIERDQVCEKLHRDALIGRFAGHNHQDLIRNLVGIFFHISTLIDLRIIRHSAGCTINRAR